MSFEKYESTIQACLTCAIRCESCASYCLSEHEIQIMTRCMELTKNCAAISILTARFLASGSEFATRACDLCADICYACAVINTTWIIAKIAIKRALNALKSVERFHWSMFDLAVSTLPR